MKMERNEEFLNRVRLEILAAALREGLVGTRLPTCFRKQQDILQNPHSPFFFITIYKPVSAVFFWAACAGNSRCFNVIPVLLN
jgi:hypothetical protein